jgi:hypothetical protein
MLTEMLSEALCSCANQYRSIDPVLLPPLSNPGAGSNDKVPFARRARQHGRAFRDGKVDDQLPFIFFLSIFFCGG